MSSPLLHFFFPTPVPQLPPGSSEEHKDKASSLLKPVLWTCSLVHAALVPAEETLLMSLFLLLFALFSSGNRFLQHPFHVLPNARAAFRINFGSGHLCALHSISARAVGAAGSCTEG